MKFPRRVIAGVAVLATVAFPVFTAASALAAADNSDPYATGCANGAYVVKSGGTVSGYMELMWSPGCQTNWAYFDSESTAWTRIWTETQDGRSTSFFYFSGYEGWAWSNQLNAATTNARACEEVYYAAIHSWSSPSCVGQY